MTELEELKARCEALQQANDVLRAGQTILKLRCEALTAERDHLLARIETLRAVNEELQGRIANALL